MEFLYQFTDIFINYLRELWFILLLGFVLAGFIYKFIPAGLVERLLGEPGLRSIAIASTVGVILPLCCIGTLPIAVTLKRKGASLGAVLAFLVATPATSISALIVTWKLLGGVFTVALFFAVILLAFVIGIATDWAGGGKKVTLAAIPQTGCCEGCLEGEGDTSGQSLSAKVKDALKYGFITLPKDIGGEILLALTVASLILASAWVQHFIQIYLVGPVGYLVVVIFGLLDYVCSTASVPLAHALIESGMSPGQAFCYLLLGPITSYGTLLVIKKEFGWKIFGIYLGLLTVMSLGLGIAFDIFLT